jgi:hypothetical protein
MERILQILAAALLLAAAYFLWQDTVDWAFVCGVLAACSFFLAMRFQIKGRMAVRAEAEISDDEYRLTESEAGEEITTDTSEKTVQNTTLQG